MVSVVELTDKRQTGEAMYKMVDNFSQDIDCFTEDTTGKRLSDIPFNSYYNLVKNLPFKKDQTGTEIITRPMHIFSTPFNGYDCKKKAIAIAAWLNQNHIPYRFKAVSRNADGDIHHVIVEAKSGDKWIEIDATYPDNYINQDQGWTNEELLPSDGPGTLGSNHKLVCMYGMEKPSIIMHRDFLRNLRNRYPEAMGSISGAAVAAIAAIITAVGGITATIISAVSNKRQQEREIAHNLKMQEMQQKKMVEQANLQKKQTEKKDIPGWIPWAAIGGAALLFM